MKVFALFFLLVSTSPFAMATPVAREDRERALLADSPPVRLGGRASNETEDLSQSQDLRNANLTETDNRARARVNSTQTESQTLSSAIPGVFNSSETDFENVTHSLVVSGTLNETETLRRSVPRIRRNNLQLRSGAFDETEAA
ncbi:hypothetical protein GGS23DRAFT_596321 [Durotheca rogersii]|uniref:uncharacterized protein n=1 Tax=Durotheca rogersii TaxID=419775 RepID=UPI00221F19AF|nr:uncharacterized protein GGS23DRAFT_596321 [Durotheca rogersii]KAI5863825.1 hypothetical protein GGS23DRAFT_596321 [Durotheca rogersii]